MPVRRPICFLGILFLCGDDFQRLMFCFFVFQVDDQMKLLQHSWSDLLILDHLHQRIHNRLQVNRWIDNLFMSVLYISICI